jgi:uncharacterized membrane protein YdjX (TVP38/TMEM64 family)
MRETGLREFQTNHPVLVYLMAFLIYVCVTGLSLPGAAALTLVYGWYFGLLPGVILVSFASTTGATVAFLFSRFIFRDAIRNRFAERLVKFDQALQLEGAFYLFTLRLIPIVPFFVINLVMGLTRLKIWTFWWVSQLGMLAGTIVYVYAGSTLPSLMNLTDTSQIRVSEVTDWDGLIADLKSFATSQTASPSRRIWQLFSDETRAAVINAQSPPTKQDKMRIVDGLNQVTKRADLALDADWQAALEPKSEDPATRIAETKIVTRVNRDLLEAILPDKIGAPQPIISRQLVIAFVILGLFPLIVKKVLSRFHPVDKPLPS